MPAQNFLWLEQTFCSDVRSSCFLSPPDFSSAPSSLFSMISGTNSEINTVPNTEDFTEQAAVQVEAGPETVRPITDFIDITSDLETEDLTVPVQCEANDPGTEVQNSESVEDPPPVTVSAEPGPTIEGDTVKAEPVPPAEGDTEEADVEAPPRPTQATKYTVFTRDACPFDNPEHDFSVFLANNPDAVDCFSW